MRRNLWSEEGWVDLMRHFREQDIDLVTRIGSDWVQGCWASTQQVRAVTVECKAFVRYSGSGDKCKLRTLGPCGRGHRVQPRRLERIMVEEG